MTRRRHKKLKRTFKRILVLLIVCFGVYFFIKILFDKNYIEEVNIKDNKIVIKLTTDNVYCALSKDENIKDEEWIQEDNQTCTFDLVSDNVNLYIKKDNKVINATKNKVFFELYENEEVYLSLKEEYNYFKYSIGNINKIDIDISNNIIEYNDGIVKSINKGESFITFKYNDYTFKSNIIVTSLINKMEIKDKKNLSCNKYSEEESILLDKILESRIKNVGYKTRAGVVEAARFLALSFPYKIEYFYENGRQTTNGVDGEGRYYHKGLYLSESKYSTLTGSTYTSNKGIWGCDVYSYPNEKKSANGLDCSGFVSWALLNGGFDVKDVGAGWSDKLDLTDYGEVLKLDSKNYNKLRIGDLLHSERLGGHIGIIIGEKEDYFYVAQAIWYDQNGLVVSKISKKELYKEFPHGVLMDEYYIEDGRLTNMW